MRDSINEIWRRGLNKVFLKHRFVLDALYYKVIYQSNVYRDNLSVDYDSPFEVKFYIEFNPPVRLAKKFGWFKEGENLPILGYMPFTKDLNPSLHDKIEVLTPIYKGVYLVNQFRYFGFDKDVLWVFYLSPKRD